MQQLSAERIGVDDANIYFRYARNIADGLGIVWNPGGERVEGATSILWTLVCALAFRLTSNPETWLFRLSILGLALGLTIWAGATIRCFAALEYVRPRRLFGVLAGVTFVGWCVASPAFFTWTTTTLMDSGLWTTALLIGAACVLDADGADPAFPSWALPASLWVIAWARPEGIVVGALLVAFLGLSRYGRIRDVRTCLKSLAVPAVTFVAANVLLYGFRRVYFHVWLPNTYYAKVGGDTTTNLGQGWLYLRSFIAAYPLFLFLLLAALAVVAIWLVMIVRPHPSRRPNGLLTLSAISSAMLLLGTCCAVSVGGDHFGGWRFFQPYWPFASGVLLSSLLLPARLGFSGAGTSKQTRVAFLALGCAAVCAVATYAMGPIAWRDLARTSRLRHEFTIAEEGRRSGHRLNEMFPGDQKPTIAVIRSGGMPLAYDGFVYDLLGLNNTAMAHANSDRSCCMKGHAAFDSRIFYLQQPDIVVLDGRICDLGSPVRQLGGGDWMDRSMKGIHRQRLFRELYAPVALATPAMARQGHAICEYANLLFLEKLDADLVVRVLPH